MGDVLRLVLERNGVLSPAMLLSGALTTNLHRPPYGFFIMGVVQPLSAAGLTEESAFGDLDIGKAGQLDVDAIDEIVEAGARLQDWPEPIARMYHEAGEETLYREYMFLFVLGFVVCFSTIVIDLLINRHMVEQGTLLRSLTTGPVTALGLVAGARRWASLTRVMLGMGPIAFVGVLATLSLQLAPEDAARYMLGAALALAMGNMTLPLSIRALVAFNLAGIAVAFACVGMGGLQALADQAENLTALTIISLSTLPLAARVERLRRHNFALNLRTHLVSAQLVDANCALRRLSDTDALTGVGNRRWFEYMFETRIEPAEDQEIIGLMMIDLDHFKPFNDKHGHQAGDSCLKVVASTLRDVFDDAGGIFARYGGEEFIGVLRSNSATKIVALAEKARASVEGNHRALITASIGVAVAPAAIRLPREELIEMADAALYSGKNAGRNRVEVVEAGPLGDAAEHYETFG